MLSFSVFDVVFFKFCHFPRIFYVIIAVIICSYNFSQSADVIIWSYIIFCYNSPIFSFCWKRDTLDPAGDALDILGPEAKVNKHDIVLISFCPKSKPYMTLVNIREKNFAYFLSIFIRIRSSNISAMTEHTQNKFFCCEVCEFFLMFTLVLLNRFLDGISEFRSFIVEMGRDD